MVPTKISYALLSLAILILANTGCSHDGASSGGPLTVPLSYTPAHAQDSVRSYPGRLPQTRIYVGAIADQRDRKDAIGENVESGNPIPIRAGSDPAEFVRRTLATQLQRAGLHVVSDPSQADRTLTGDLTHFWVVEKNNYSAEITATLRLTDASGATKWEGAASGHGETFGRSLSAENYRESLSDAMVRLTYENLLVSSDFQNALNDAASTGPTTR